MIILKPRQLFIGSGFSTRYFDGNARKIKRDKLSKYLYWRKAIYNTNGDMIYNENSSGRWEKKEYDQFGNISYFENSKGTIKECLIYLITRFIMKILMDIGEKENMIYQDMKIILKTQVVIKLIRDENR